MADEVVVEGDESAPVVVPVTVVIPDSSDSGLVTQEQLQQTLDFQEQLAAKDVTIGDLEATVQRQSQTIVELSEELYEEVEPEPVPEAVEEQPPTADDSEPDNQHWFFKEKSHS
jgi:hypothetical protein